MMMMSLSHKPLLPHVITCHVLQTPLQPKVVTSLIDGPLPDVFLFFLFTLYKIRPFLVK